MNENRPPVSVDRTRFLDTLRQKCEAGEGVDRDEAAYLLSEEIDTATLIELAELPRRRYFQDLVQIHVINNVKNGHCPEDCGYCAQRSGGAREVISSYSTKSDEEILQEAQAAAKAGAHRYCLVTSGRGPSEKQVRHYGALIRTIKERHGIEVCLSAGILTDPEHAQILSEAGLDRYNHNINTSETRYESICTTHNFSERIETLTTMNRAGISLCSGVILGMGEEDDDLLSMAFQLKEYGVVSIPVNFFIPVPGHTIEQKRPLDADRCLRLLALFRLIHPRAEIRMAAGREYYLKERQPEGLRVANSLFVSGYLNVKGDDAYETVRMILRSGYRIDTDFSELPEVVGKSGESLTDLYEKIYIKEESDLRPYIQK